MTESVIEQAIRHALQEDVAAAVTIIPAPVPVTIQAMGDGYDGAES